MVDDREAVAQGVGLVEVVGREEDGGAGRAQAPDLVPHAGAGLGVEAGGGLVEEQQARAVDHADGDVEAAAHAAGVGVRRAVAGVREVDGREELGRPLVGCGPVTSRTGGPA